MFGSTNDVMNFEICCLFTSCLPNDVIVLIKLERNICTYRHLNFAV